MKKFLSFMVAIVATMTLSSCYFTNPSYDEEVAFKKKPWFFGKTGVDPEPCTSFTCYVQTTSAVHFYMLPQKHDFKFDDLVSNDATLLDVSMYMVTQIKKGGTPDLLANYGERWYETFIEPYFKNKVRELVSAYSPFDLMSNREVLQKFDKQIASEMQTYVTQLSKKKNFPVEIVQIVTDRVIGNDDLIKAMNETAATNQKIQTQNKKLELERVRAESEKQRALADKAYMENMHLTPQEYIQLKWIEVVSSKNANIDVMVGPATSMWNVKQK